jgi:hypothetical protein
LAQIPPSMRTNRCELDLRLIQRACERIGEISASLDVAVVAARSDAERMRLLREATNQIVRHANDSAQAYGRAIRGLRLDVEAGRGLEDERERMRGLLQTARASLLAQLGRPVGRTDPPDERWGSDSLTPAWCNNETSLGRNRGSFVCG